MTSIKVVTGLLVVHVLWAASYLTGALLLHALRNGERSEASRIERSIDFVLATALGMSTIMLSLFLLGAAGLLNPIASLVTWLVVLAALFAIVLARGDSLTDIAHAFLRPLAIFRSSAVLGLYLIAVVASVPAVLPPVAFDTTMYHLAEAVNWVHSGHLSADPFLRAPYNAFNFELLFSLIFLYHLDAFVLFVDWLPFVCAALGLYALTTWLLARYALTEPRSLPLCSAIGFVTALAFLGSPLVLSYALIGYVDVASGFFLLAATAALLRSLDRFQPYAVVTAVIAGTFLGTKIQLILFGPLILVALLYAAHITRTARRQVLIACVAFVIFAAPWYVRNLVATGDPITPTLNVMLHRTDPIYNKVDYDGIRWNLAYGPQTIFDAPRDFIFNTTPAGFLFDPGTSTSIALVAIMPVVALVLVLFRKRWRVAPQLLALSVFVAYGVLATMAVSLTLGRYALTYFPVFLAMLSFLCVVAIKAAMGRWKIVDPTAISVAAIALILVFAIPEPKSAAAYQNYIGDFTSARLAVKSPDQYLALAGEGDLEARDLARLIASSHVAGNALDIRYENAAYYFLAAGATSVGDWFGPGRYADLYAALRGGGLARYFQQFDINSALIGTRSPGWSQADLDALVKAIQQMGFIEVTMTGHTTREFVRPDVDKGAAPGILASVPRVSAQTK